ncbi:MAG TPA: glycosyltransferase family 9 protein, partial [Tepidisphaeraceae bacterium]
WRWRASGLTKPRSFSRPQWTGSPIRRGETMLLHAEQGFGDTIHFIRFTRLVAERGAKVILECPPELSRLMEGSAAELGITQVVRLSQPPIPLPPFDIHCPVMSLPMGFRTDLGSIPSSSYLKADSKLVNLWSTRLGKPSGTRVGLAWAGRPSHRNDQNRSIDLNLLASHLSNIPGVTYFSLQKGAATNLPGSAMPMIDHTSELSDFADTAALIANLDLVITVDTAVAHLAGALGKPVWVLLPFVPDWRWMLNRDDSPWYPTMRLFRQQSIGDWTVPLESVSEQLRIFSASSASLR